MFLSKILLLVWLAITPDEQMARIATISDEFCEQQSCSEVKVDIIWGRENVYFFAECREWFM